MLFNDLHLKKIIMLLPVIILLLLLVNKTVQSVYKAKDMLVPGHTFFFKIYIHFWFCKVRKNNTT